MRNSTQRTFLCGLGALTASALTISLLGCGGDATSPSVASTPYWTLRFNQHAVQIALTAPQNKIQLKATPLTLGGQVPVGVGSVQYTAKDSTVTVDATGLVTAQYVTSQTALVVATATDTIHHITVQDTCFFQVTDAAPSVPLSGFTVQSVLGDTIPLNVGTTLSIMATDASGNPVQALAYFTSADPSIAELGAHCDGDNVCLTSSGVSGHRTGQVLLYAETWAYGVAKRDSLLLTVGVQEDAAIKVLPVTPTGSTDPVLTFWPQIIKVTTGSVVTWSNLSFTESIDVVFDDPTHVASALDGNISYRFSTGGGNIAPWVFDTVGTGDVAAGICAALLPRYGPFGYTCPSILQTFGYSARRLRSFPVAGTYHYHSKKWGANGTIIVQ